MSEYLATQQSIKVGMEAAKVLNRHKLLLLMGKLSKEEIAILDRFFDDFLPDEDEDD